MKRGWRSFRSRVERVLLDRPAYTRAFIASLYATPQTEEYLDRITEAALSMPDNAAALVTANVALFSVRSTFVLRFGPWTGRCSSYSRR